MESDFEKKLHGLRPKRLTPDEKGYLWSNVEDGIAVEQYIKAHKRTRLEAFNIFNRVRRTRTLIAGIITSVLIFGSFGTVALADHARPGDLLFPLDLATENIRLRLVSEEHRDELQIQFASERLDEVKELLALAGIDYEEIGIESQLPALYTESDDNAASSTEDTGNASSTDDTNNDENTDTNDDGANNNNNDEDSDTVSTTDSSGDDTDNNSNDDTHENETSNLNASVLAQTSNAFVVALEYLKNTRASLVADGNDIGVMAIDAFISELTVLADNHVNDIEKTHIAVKNDGSKVDIAIRASIDDVKTEFNFKEKTNENGDTEHKIALGNGTSALSLNVDGENTVFEEDHGGNSNTQNDNSRHFDIPEFELCYKKKTVSLGANDLSKYLKKGAHLGACGNSRGDEQKHDEDDDKDDDHDNGNNNDKKVYLCHKGETINVSIFSKWAHLSHGDTVGKCSDGDNNDNKITMPACSFTSADDRTIVKFGGPTIRSDQSESNAETDLKSVSLSEGIYKVTLMSWDGYKGREDDSQPHEEWYIKFFKNTSLFGGTALVATSSAVSDIPDNVTEETVTEVVNEGLHITDDIDKVRAFHNVYPDTESPNSVHPICAAFDRLGNIDDAAPVISNIETDATTTKATITWKTNEGAKTVIYYDTNNTIDGSEPHVSDNILKTDHTQALSSLSASTTYYFRIVATDEAGNTSTSSVRSFTTLSDTPAPDVTAPLITGIVVNATTTAANIAWSTNENTTGVVWYGTTTPLVVDGDTDGVLESTLHTTHGITITGLLPETVYHYLIVATDNSGNTSTSTEDSFTTTAVPVVDETPPVVSNLSAEASTTDATVTFNTDESAESTIWYSMISPVPIGSPSLSSAGFLTEHAFHLSGLDPETTYYFLIEVEDEHGNSTMESEESFTTTAPPDETAPVISDISATPDTNSADISWETDEDTTGTVLYSSSTPLALGNVDGEVLSSTLQSSHSIVLSSLSASTTYYFIVVAEDEAGNTSTSTENSFDTL